MYNPNADAAEIYADEAVDFLSASFAAEREGDRAAADALRQVGRELQDAASALQEPGGAANAALLHARRGAMHRLSHRQRHAPYFA